MPISFIIATIFASHCNFFTLRFVTFIILVMAVCHCWIIFFFNLSPISIIIQHNSWFQITVILSTILIFVPKVFSFVQTIQKVLVQLHYYCLSFHFHFAINYKHFSQLFLEFEIVLEKKFSWKKWFYNNTMTWYYFSPNQNQQQ